MITKCAFGLIGFTTTIFVFTGSAQAGTPPSPPANSQIYCDPAKNANVSAKLKEYETKIKATSQENDRRNLVALHQQTSAQLQCNYRPAR